MNTNKIQIMRLLEDLEIPYEEYKESLKIESKDSIIAFFHSGNIGLVDYEVAITGDLDGIIKYIKNNW